MSFEPPQNVVVVGGGIVGSSIAWHLSQSATTHTTVVAGKIGGIATPNSFAWINAGSVEDDQEFYFDFRLRSMKRWRQIEQEIPGLSEYIRWNGSTNWEIQNETEIKAYRDRLKRWGYDVLIVNKTEIQEVYEPGVSDSLVPELALRFAEEGQMEAHIVAAKLLEEAQANGAGLLETNATSLLKKDGRIVGVVLEGGEEVPADHVVVAAGLGSVDLFATQNLPLPVHSVSGLLINTVPTEKKFLNGVIYAVELHMRQTEDGRIRSGSEFGGSPPGDDPQAVADALFAKLQSACKDGNKLEYDYYTIGHRPTPRDGIPILGKTGVYGLSVAVMHSGVSNGALVGQLLSKLVLTGEEDPALADFSLARFNNRTKAA